MHLFASVLYVFHQTVVNMLEAYSLGLINANYIALLETGW